MKPKKYQHSEFSPDDFDTAFTKYSDYPLNWGTNKPAPCYESHKPLKIGDFTIYGGSCLDPKIKDADIYVGFERGMHSPEGVYPWNDRYSVSYYIPDMRAPNDPDSFKKLIEWLAVQLTANKKIHLGCVGGHGRTGLVMAALVTYMTGNKDSIAYVRENYCKKVVETAIQMKFLETHFGIIPKKVSKGYPSRKSKSTLFNERYVTRTTVEIRPEAGSRNLWGFDNK